MSIIVHSITVNCRPFRKVCLCPHIGGIVVERLVPRHVDGILYGGELVHVGQLPGRLDDASLLHRHGQLLLVAEVTVLDDVGRAIWIVDNFALELLNVGHVGLERVWTGEPGVVVVSVLQHSRYPGTGG